MTTPSDAGRAGEREVVITARRGGKNLRLVEWFNDICPVGSPVYYWPGVREGRPLKSVTRSAAWLLGGHSPVVLVEGYAGGIALSHVMGYQPEPTTTTPTDPEATL